MNKDIRKQTKMIFLPALVLCLICIVSVQYIIAETVDIILTLGVSVPLAALMTFIDSKVCRYD